MPPALRSKLGDPAVDRLLNTFNEELLARVEHSGRHSSRTRSSRKIFIVARACIVNFRTSDADIEAVPELVRLGRQSTLLAETESPSRLTHGRAKCGWKRHRMTFPAEGISGEVSPTVEESVFAPGPRILAFRSFPASQ